MDNTTIIILCAGEATRWNNYLGVPKQLIKIGGESLLERTVKLCHYKDLHNIHIVSYDNRLKVKACHFFKPDKNQWIVETLLSTQPLWNEKTIILLGDVFFTKDAIATIVGSDDCIHMYGRYEASRYTFTRWGEIFALSFGRNDWSKVVSDAEAICVLAKASGRGKLWDLYRSMAGFSLDQPLVETSMFVSIHDFTDDIDSPKEYRANLWGYRCFISKNSYRKILLFIWIKYIALRRLPGNIRKFCKKFCKRAFGKCQFSK